MEWSTNVIESWIKNSGIFQMNKLSKIWSNYIKNSPSDVIGDESKQVILTRFQLATIRQTNTKKSFLKEKWFYHT